MQNGERGNINKAVREELKDDWLPSNKKAKDQTLRMVDFHKFFCKATGNKDVEDGDSIISTIQCIKKNEKDLRRFFILNNIQVVEKDVDSICVIAKGINKWSTCCTKFSYLRSWLKSTNPEKYKEKERTIKLFHDRCFKKAQKEQKNRVIS